MYELKHVLAKQKYTPQFRVLSLNLKGKASKGYTEMTELV